MSDLDVPLQERVRAQLVIKGTRERLYWVALKITGSAANAGDLVQDAMVEVLRSGGSPWEKWTFLTHMTFVMRRVWDQQQRAHNVKNEIADEDVTRGTKGLSREAPADDELDRRRSHVATGIVERLLAWAETQAPRVKQCIELRLQGIEEPAEQAGVLRCAVEEMYEANRILRRRAPQIRKEWERGEEQRMSDLRERSGTKRRKEGS